MDTEQGNGFPCLVVVQGGLICPVVVVHGDSPLLDRGDRPGVPTQLNSQVVAADPKTGQMTSLVAISNKC